MNENTSPSMPRPLAPKKQKPSLVIAASSVVMLVIVVAWAMTLRSSLSSDVSQKNNLFTSIADQLRNVFGKDVNPAVLGGTAAEEGSEEKLRELRAHVFPEFAEIEDQEESSQ